MMKQLLDIGDVVLVAKGYGLGSNVPDGTVGVVVNDTYPYTIPVDKVGKQVLAAIAILGHATAIPTGLVRLLPSGRMGFWWYRDLDYLRPEGVSIMVINNVDTLAPAWWE